jgi:hypothetical protein
MTGFHGLVRVRFEDQPVPVAGDAEVRQVQSPDVGSGGGQELDDLRGERPRARPAASRRIQIGGCEALRMFAVAAVLINVAQIPPSGSSVVHPRSQAIVVIVSCRSRWCLATNSLRWSGRPAGSPGWLPVVTGRAAIPRRGSRVAGRGSRVAAKAGQYAGTERQERTVLRAVENAGDATDFVRPLERHQGRPNSTTPGWRWSRRNWWRGVRQASTSQSWRRLVMASLR